MLDTVKIISELQEARRRMLNPPIPSPVRQIVEEFQRLQNNGTLDLINQFRSAIKETPVEKLNQSLGMPSREEVEAAVYRIESDRRWHEFINQKIHDVQAEVI